MTAKEAFKKLCEYFKMDLKARVCYNYKNHYGFRVSEAFDDGKTAYVGLTVFFVNKYNGKVYEDSDDNVSLPKPSDKYTFVDVRTLS